MVRKSPTSTAHLPRNKSSCIIRMEAHTILFAIVVMNVLWLFYAMTFGSDTALETGAVSPHQLFRHAMTSEKEEVDDSILFAFTLRDAKRLTPVDPAPGVHIFDLVDVYQENQQAGKSQLFLDGHYIGKPLCQDYSLECYQVKLLQVFHYALHNLTTTPKYFYYIEADNVLCLPLRQIQELAVRQDRYFIGTGVGASGWLMRRDFLQDFVEAYATGRGTKQHEFVADKETFVMPDVIASWMLMESQSWSVTNRYLVSHTILKGIGNQALTRRTSHNHNPLLPGGGNQNLKHLPRCLEPHRGKWGFQEEDEYGWDYFDYQKCPDAEVFPCHETGDLPEPTIKFKQTTMPPGVDVSQLLKKKADKVNMENFHKAALGHHPRMEYGDEDDDSVKHHPAEIDPAQLAQLSQHEQEKIQDEQAHASLHEAYVRLNRLAQNGM